MPAFITTRERVLELIQEDKWPPTWRWCATAQYDDLVAGLWEWQADIPQEAIVLAQELIHIEQEALGRWPTRKAVAAADDAWWKCQP